MGLILTESSRRKKKMSFQVNANIAALNVYNNLGVHQAKAADSLSRISSGLKASGFGDIASQGTANGIYGNLQATSSNISQVQAAINQLQVADAAYGEQIALGQKGQQVALGGANAGADTSALWSQLTAIEVGISSIQDNTQFNGAVFTTALTPNMGVGALGTAPTPGNAADPVIAGAAAAAATVANIATTATNMATFVAATVDIRATNAANIATLQNSLQVLNATAANELAGVGQAQDTDIATEMMSLTSANIMTEAATAMLAQAMQLPNSVLKLLQ
jgi:flagellin